MAGIEETLTRIGKMGGVEGFVITDAEGHVLRQSKSYTDEEAGQYALEVLKLTKRARHVVRDLEPKVRMVDGRGGSGGGARGLAGRAAPGFSPAALGWGRRALSRTAPSSHPRTLPRTRSRTAQTDLEFFRLRMKNNREILAAPGKDFLVVVVRARPARPTCPGPLPLTHPHPSRC